MQSSRHSVVLSLGSNCGDRADNVSKAMEWLKTTILTEAECSQIYETAPVGHSGVNYMNAVVSGCFSGILDSLEKECKEYELEHGRDTESRRFNRVPVDIDIVIADEEIIRPRDFKCSFFQKGFRQLRLYDCYMHPTDR